MYSHNLRKYKEGGWGGEGREIHTSDVVLQRALWGVRDRFIGRLECRSGTLDAPPILPFLEKERTRER